MDEVRADVDTEMIISHISALLFQCSQVFVFVDELIKDEYFTSQNRLNHYLILKMHIILGHEGEMISVPFFFFFFLDLIVFPLLYRSLSLVM